MHVPPFILALAAIATALVVVRLRVKIAHALATRENVEARLAAFSSLLPVGIFEADSNGRCIYANDVAREIAGLDPDAPIGDSGMAALHPDDRDWVLAAWHAATAADIGRGTSGYARARVRGDRPASSVRSPTSPITSSSK